MNRLSFGRKEEGGLGTRIPPFELTFESLTNFFSIILPSAVAGFQIWCARADLEPDQRPVALSG